MNQETMRGKDEALLAAGFSIGQLVEKAIKMSPGAFEVKCEQMLGTFRVSEETATAVFRQLSTFNDPRDVNMWAGIRHQLGIDSKNTSTEMGTVAGMLLIAYVGESTRLLGVLEGKDNRATEQQLREHLGVNPHETTQQTFDRLLQVAIDNSKRTRQPLK